MRLALLLLWMPCAAWAQDNGTSKAGTSPAFGLEGKSAFDRPMTSMPRGRGLDFTVGQALFQRLWVVPPASTKSTDGLGPLYNARSCAACHRNAGRDSPDDERPGLLLRLSIGEDENGAPIAVPNYGLQLQDHSIPNVPAEGNLGVSYTETEIAFADGETISLRAPTYTIEQPQYGALPANMQSGPRIAPAMIGMGLMQAVSDAEILAYADPDDADGDGISGRPNQILHKGEWVIGRFGWKANEPSLSSQIAAAFAGDLGLGSADFPDFGDCTPTQTDCRNAPHGNTGTPENVEIPTEVMDFVEFYSAHLGIPPRRDRDVPQVLRGEEIFMQIGCASCHRPTMRTAPDAPPALANLEIEIYSDMLLHDMGEGLADGRPDWGASGSEWRTPPLWGIGLVEVVNGHTNFLHDGRARSLLEAVMWHGGEAEAARNRAAALPAADRDALIAFLESL